MQALVVGDHEAMTAQIRQVLLREGQDCPVSHVVRLDSAAGRLEQVKIELAVVALSPDPERALAVVTAIRAKVTCRMLVVGPAGDSKLVLRALRGGADDYIDELELVAELEDAISRLKSEMTARSSDTGRTIAVLAPSGGSGSSTLAANLATVLAKEHKSALLCDLKLESGDLAALLDLKPTHSLADLCLNVQRMDRVLFERSLVRHASGVHLLAAPLHYSEVVHVTVEAVRKVLNLGRTLFPYVVIDLDHNFHVEQVDALQQSDLILVVLRLDFASLRNARRTLEQLERLGIDREMLRLVVNRFGQPKEVPFAKAEEALGLKIFHYVPDDSRSVNRANNSGVPVVLESPAAKIAKSVVKLALSVNGQHKGSSASSPAVDRLR
jgi:pilus assembly protein CpaE